MKIRILHLRDTYEIGGPGKTIIETISHIDKNHFELHIGVFLTRNETDESLFIKAARDNGFFVHLIRGYNQYDPMVLFQLVNIIRKFNIHIHRENKSKLMICLVKRSANNIKMQVYCLGH